MMVSRLVILVLTLANLAFFGWTEGWFDGVSTLKSTGDREPQRLASQVAPEVMRLWNASTALSAGTGGSQPATANAGRPQAASGKTATVGIGGSGIALSEAASAPALAPVTAAAPTEPALACVESGPYPGNEAVVAESALKGALPPGAWAGVPSERAGVWLVFMGRFIDNEARKRKECELNRRNAAFEEIDSPPQFTRGLSLGRFGSKQEAEVALAEFNRIGIRTARVMAFSPPSVVRTFRIERADPTMIDKLRSLGLSMPVVPCATPRS
jgi:hypothetical protein